VFGFSSFFPACALSAFFLFGSLLVGQVSSFIVLWRGTLKDLLITYNNSELVIGKYIFRGATMVFVDLPRGSSRDDKIYFSTGFYDGIIKQVCSRVGSFCGGLIVVIGSRKLGLGVLLGVVAFVPKASLPSPVDKMIVVFEALALGLASLLIVKWGATFASLIDGLLLTLFRAWFFPFSLVFALVFGLLIDGSFHLLGVASEGRAKTVRLMAAVSVSTALTGVLSMVVTTATGVMPNVPLVYLVILVVGVINGVAAGYLASVIWNRRVKTFKRIV
jgi:hypothetical protein